MNKSDIKPAAWGAVAGAILVLIAAFWTGWVVTSSSAQEMAEQKSEQAVLASLAPICVEQFGQAANGQASLAQLKATDSWKRAELVEAKGWATMPGSESPTRGIARECADRIMQLAN